MSENQPKSVVDYLRLPDSTPDEEHVKEIRDRYRQVLQLPANAAPPEDLNEEAIVQVARQLNLQAETDETRDYLRECVKYEDIQDAVAVVHGKLVGEVEPINESILSPTTSCPPPRSQPRVTQDPPSIAQDLISVADIDCLLTVKIGSTEVHQFLHSFLLQDAKALRQPVTT